MPSAPSDPGPADPGPAEAAGPPPGGPRGAARRMWQEKGGPMLVEGPVEFVCEDGTVVRSDRPVVALCTCRRSRRQPFCDTSHRRRPRRGPAADGADRHDE